MSKRISLSQKFDLIDLRNSPDRNRTFKKNTSQTQDMHAVSSKEFGAKRPFEIKIVDSKDDRKRLEALQKYIEGKEELERKSAKIKIHFT